MSITAYFLAFIWVTIAGSSFTKFQLNTDLMVTFSLPFLYVKKTSTFSGKLCLGVYFQQLIMENTTDHSIFLIELGKVVM